MSLLLTRVRPGPLPMFPRRTALARPGAPTGERTLPEGIDAQEAHDTLLAYGYAELAVALHVPHRATEAQGLGERLLAAATALGGGGHRGDYRRGLGAAAPGQIGAVARVGAWLYACGRAGYAAQADLAAFSLSVPLPQPAPADGASAAAPAGPTPDEPAVPASASVDAASAHCAGATTRPASVETVVSDSVAGPPELPPADAPTAAQTPVTDGPVVAQAPVTDAAVAAQVTVSDSPAVPAPVVDAAAAGQVAAAGGDASVAERAARCGGTPADAEAPTGPVYVHDPADYFVAEPAPLAAEASSDQLPPYFRDWLVDTGEPPTGTESRRAEP